MSGRALRNSARFWREHTLGLSTDDAICASDICASCAQVTGFSVQLIGYGDPLLAGALAVLDRDSRAIWIDSSLSPDHRHAIVAHEFAHLHLHSDCSPDDFNGSSDFHRPDQDALDAAAGYSPRQRREVDANIWAAELLMPEPMLRRVFYGAGAGAPDIAAQLGLDASLVRSQMMAVLLRAPSVSAVTDVETQHVSAPAEPGLDSSQAAAATVAFGPYLLAAGPGTGKTRTLVARCVHLVRDKRIAPEKILALTFSRKAAAEMRERLIAAGVGTAVSGPWVGTFHSFCLETLRRYGARAGLRSGWRVAGETEAFGILERHLPRLKLRQLSNINNPVQHLTAVLTSISRAKDELCSPDRFAALVRQHVMDCAGGPAGDEAARLTEVAQVYAAYQQLLTQSNRLDYGDLIVKTVEMLEADPNLSRSLQSQYPHIVADEYQDVNYASARLLRLLAGPAATGLWAVGDRRQSIYRFRGASPANIAQFDMEYPNGKRGDLKVNYRSQPMIVRLVESAADRVSAAEPETFRGWDCRRSDQPAAGVRMAIADTPAAQAAGTAAKMRELRDCGLAYADQVVLVRSHNQATLLADQLLAEGIPVLYVGDLFERPEIKDLLCIVDLFSPRGSAGAALLRRVTTLCDSNSEVDSLIERAKMLDDSGRSLADRILDDANLCKSDPGLAGLLASAGADRSPAAIATRFLFDDPRYLRHLDVEMARDPLTGAARLLSIRRLLELAGELVRVYAREFGEAHYADTDHPPIDAVSWFMREIRRYGAAGERVTAMADPEDGVDAVRIMTIHAAKGLEFPCVFLPNLIEGSFPLRDRAPLIAQPRGLTADRLMGDIDQEEETCLFFVALSRARDHLILSRSSTRGDKGAPAKASSFLTLIDPGLQKLGVQPAIWRSPDSPPTPSPSTARAEPLLIQAPKPRFSASSLETYQRCPRLYFYRCAQGLTGAAGSGVGARYRECLRTVESWMQDQWRAGRLPDELQVAERTNAFWVELGVPEELYTGLARERALELLLQTRQLYANHFATETPAPDQVLEAELDNCVVNVAADLATIGRDGRVRVVRQIDSKPGDSDHTHPKLSLLRTGMNGAFKGRAGEVELWYAQSGEVKSAPLRASFEPGRLRKYELAADGIIRGRFNPEPADSRQCATCPFHFVCPE